ncbi:LysR family transcriptional regulator [Clostridium sp. AL.422]|uniref:LysR family transcriptional regulator n=1 Tax=Clostridium TaxID=1485 RepID=UPI00293DD585|nr:MULTISPECIES: LysR family transcriptional regulator [unclassified Clostridium]MDV4150751.1 LysR family transcriptional regulator [Clostridium sp. AL.422]
MNIEQLKTFCAVIEYGSFLKASEVLFCSQPAISKQIKSLERNLGFSLFDREGKKVNLNSNGRIVYAYAKKILDEISEMNQKLLESNNYLPPIISFGATNFIGVHIITPNIGRFKDNFPEASVSFTIDFNQNILKMLNLNKFSFAFVAESDLLKQYQDIKTDFFRDDELVLVVSPNHPWTSRNSIDIEELKDQTFLVSQPNSAIRKFIEDTLHTNRIVINNIHNLYNIEGIKQSILSGQGISILPKKAISTELKHKLLIEVPINNLPLKRKLFIAYKKNKQFTTLEKDFINSLI